MRFISDFIQGFVTTILVMAVVYGLQVTRNGYTELKVWLDASHFGTTLIIWFGTSLLAGIGWALLTRRLARPSQKPQSR